MTRSTFIQVCVYLTFALAAKNGARLGRAAVFVALLGVLIAGAGFFAVVTSPGDVHAAGAPGRP